MSGICDEGRVRREHKRDTEKGITYQKQIPTINTFPIQRLLVLEQKDKRLGLSKGLSERVKGGEE